MCLVRILPREPRGWELGREPAVQGRPHTGCTPELHTTQTGQGSWVELKS